MDFVDLSIKLLKSYPVNIVSTWGMGLLGVVVCFASRKTDRSESDMLHQVACSLRSCDKYLKSWMAGVICIQAGGWPLIKQARSTEMSW